MRKTTKIALAVGAALSLGLAAAELTAHPSDGGYGPGSGMGAGMHGSGMMGNGMGPGAGMGAGMQGYGMGFGASPEAAGKRLAELKSQLAITAQQEPAWQAFVDNANAQAASRQAWFATMHQGQATASAPELMGQRAEMMKQRLGGLESATAALNNLYAVLTPEQKAGADRAFGGFGPGHRGGPVGRMR